MMAALAQGWRALRAASPATQALALALFALTLLMLPFGRSDSPAGPLAPLSADAGYLFRQRPAADFYSVYDAGARLLAGRDPYGVNADTGRAGHRAPYVATYRYLPITALLLGAPLNILPPRAAFVAWTLICAALLAANFLRCIARRPEFAAVFAVVWFAWFPMIAELHMGQFTLLMATALLWGSDAILRGTRGGIGWFAAVAIKVYPIAMAPSLWIWGRRRLVALTIAILGGTTLAWMLFVPSQIREGMVDRGVGGRVIGAMRPPYAGAQGPQEMVTALAFLLREGTVKAPERWQAPANDPAWMINAALLAAYAAVCAWALWTTRRAPSVHAIALFWMAWFFAYHDCWEHHYLFLQSLLALLLLHGAIDRRLALACCLFAGGPSLWWLWYRLGYAGNPFAETIGALYFIQRPIALLLLMAAAVKGIRDAAPP